jgi:hypothetical protein
MAVTAPASAGRFSAARAETPGLVSAFTSTDSRQALQLPEAVLPERLDRVDHPVDDTGQAGTQDAAQVSGRTRAGRCSVAAR